MATTTSASAPVPPNVHSAIAAQITAGRIRTVEQRLLDEAIANVRQRYTNPKISAGALDRIVQAPEAGDLLQIFEDLRATNKILRQSEKNSMLAKVGKWADTILSFKDFGANMAQINQSVAAPIWGLLCATLATLQNFLQTDEKLDRVRQSLRDWFKRHSALYAARSSLSQHLKSELVVFYEIVVEFSFDIAAVFESSTTKSAFSTATRQLIGEIQTFADRLSQAANNIDVGVNYDTNIAVHQLKDSQALGPPPPITSPNSVTNTRRLATKYFVPMSSRGFFGRSADLQAISNRFKSDPSRSCPRVVIHGIAGVGKTQTALNYAQMFQIGNSGGIYSSIFFVRADDRTTMADQFSRLAVELGLVKDNILARGIEVEVISRVKRYLNNLQDWLFIFDDVSNRDVVSEFLPEDGEGHILFTTKSAIFAHQLATEDEDVIEIKRMDPLTRGTDLVLHLALVPSPFVENDIAAARDIAIFADGLPLAIDQIVVLGDLANCGWRKALNLVETNLEKIRSNSTVTVMEHELPVFAVVDTVMKRLAALDVKAAELFKVLIYLDTAKIPLEMLHNAKANIEKYLQRQVTYDRGSKPLPPGRSRVELQTAGERAKFDLLDIEPFSFDIFRRVLHRGKYSKKVVDTDVPRVDSSSDIQMEKLWRKSEKLIQAVFEDSVNTDAAINWLIHSGLARRWDIHHIEIHELFALMGRKLLEQNHLEDNVSTAHLAATVVYLAFPIPELPDSNRVVDRCMTILPHAIASHKRLKELQILNDTTIGAELSHLIASTIDAVRKKYVLDPKHSDDARRVIYYYNDAYHGYLEAWKRLQYLDGMTWQRVVLSSFTDFTWENFHDYLPRRHLEDYERFGASAPWRCISTMAKLGSLLSEEGRHNEAIRLLQSAIKLCDDIFSAGHEDTLALRTLLMNTYMTQERWRDAYRIACQKAHGFMNPEESIIYGDGTPVRFGLCDTETGGKMARDIGLCCAEIPGMESRAIEMFQNELKAKECVWGQESGYCCGPLQRLARAHEKAGSLRSAVYWQGMAVEIALQDSEKIEAGEVMDQNDYPHMTVARTKPKKQIAWGKGQLRVLDDHTVVEIINRFRTIKTAVGELDLELEDLVESWDRDAQIWEMGKLLGSEESSVQDEFEEELDEEALADE